MRERADLCVSGGGQVGALRCPPQVITYMCVMRTEYYEILIMYDTHRHLQIIMIAMRIAKMATVRPNTYCSRNVTFVARARAVSGCACINARIRARAK